MLVCIYRLMATNTSKPSFSCTCLEPCRSHTHAWLPRAVGHRAWRFPWCGCRIAWFDSHMQLLLAPAVAGVGFGIGIGVYCVMCPSWHIITLFTTKRIAR